MLDITQRDMASNMGNSNGYASPAVGPRAEPKMAQRDLRNNAVRAGECWYKPKTRFALSEDF